MNQKNARQRAAGTSILRDERGLSTVEYVVLLVLICAGCVALWNTFGGDVRDRLDSASGEFRDNVNVEGGDSEDSPGE